MSEYNDLFENDEDDDISGSVGEMDSYVHEMMNDVESVLSGIGENMDAADTATAIAIDELLSTTYGDLEGIGRKRGKRWNKRQAKRRRRLLRKAGKLRQRIGKIQGVEAARKSKGDTSPANFYGSRAELTAMAYPLGRTQVPLSFNELVSGGPDWVKVGGPLFRCTVPVGGNATLKIQTPKPDSSSVKLIGLEIYSNQVTGSPEAILNAVNGPDKVDPLLSDQHVSTYGVTRELPPHSFRHNSKCNTTQQFSAEVQVFGVAADVLDLAITAIVAITGDTVRAEGPRVVLR